MDFLVCPACGQSVLEDDAQECPFCGSSMTAPPGGAKPTAPAKPSGPAKPAAPAAPPTAASAKPGAGSAGAAKRPGVAAKPAAAPHDDNNPFGDSTEKVKAIAAAPAATKQRPLAVICPMCETTGFVPISAAGKPVKCANPQCLVPIFDAPAPQAAPAEPAKPERSGPGVAVWGGLAIVLVLCGGVVAYFLATAPSEPLTTVPTQPTAEALELIRSMQGNNPAADSVNLERDTGGSPTKTGTNKAEPPTVAAPTRTAQMAALLKNMSDISLSNQQNRSKPFCRMLAAEANIFAGNLAGAKIQLNALKDVGSAVPFYGIPVHAQLYWTYRASQQEAEAAAQVEPIRSALPRLPKNGRIRLITAAQAAAVFVAAGMQQEAIDLLKTHRNADPIGQLAALQTQAATTSTYDLWTTYRQRPVDDWAWPQTAATISLLVGHGSEKAAQEWVVTLPDQRAVAEGLAAWAVGCIERAGIQKTTFALDRLEPLWKDVSPAVKANVLARAGQALQQVGQKETAGQALQQALAALEGVPAANELLMPEMKDVISFRLPQDGTARESAIAAGEIARLQAALGQMTESVASLDRALAWTRGMAPSLAAVASQVRSADQAGVSVLRSQLKSAMNLRTDDETRVATNNYRQALTQLEAAARNRFQLQTKLLSRATNWGLAEPVWGIVKSRGLNATDLNQAEEYLQTAIPYELIDAFARSDQPALSQEVSQTLQSLRDQKSGPPDFERIFSQLQKDPAAAGKAINQLEAVQGTADRLALLGVSDLVQQKRWAVAVLLINRISDIALREECYQQAAAQAAVMGLTAPVESQIQTVTTVTEKIALSWGLVWGLSKAPDVAPGAAQANAAMP